MAQTTELTSTLHSTKYGVNFAYAGETLKITCAIKGSNSLAWSSDEYIGRDRIELVSALPNEMQSAGQAEARFVNVSVTNGSTFLESELQIIVQSAFSIASVTCHNLGNETTKVITFKVLVAGIYTIIIFVHVHNNVHTVDVGF